MLFVHEVHHVAGAHEEEFEAAWREEFVPALGGDDSARLLWYLRQAHGTGPAYVVVTVTAVRSAEAWQRLADRLQRGDLRRWATHVDGLRHTSTAKVLRPLEWSPLRELDLAAVPVDGAEHEQHLFMEDTAWPYPGRLDDYVEGAGSLYTETLAAAEAAGRGLLRLEAAFQPMAGSSDPREVVLWQRVLDPRRLVGLLTREVPPEHRGPGTWMHDALALRDRWESRLLRSAPWSPLR